MTCPCGDVMSVEGATRDEAATKLKGMMNEDAIGKHMGEKHPGQPVMSVADCHAMIDQKMVEVK